MSDRRRVWLASLRLRAAIASGDAAGGRNGRRGGGLYAAGRTRHRPRAENQGLQIAGARLRHGRGEQKTRLRHGPARIRTRRANSGGPGIEDDSLADEQSAKSGGAGRLRSGNCRTGADPREAESAQRALFENKAGEAGTFVMNLRFRIYDLR